jgi:response regulator RpfG family c-di-GMP phosphodiesterase
MMARVLLVDDEPRVLDAIRRLLRGKFDVQTAGSADEGLVVLNREGPFAVIVSDMRMPGTNGVEFLDRARQCAPDSVRVMLTGNADQQTAVQAVNRGQVFRFLTKPCEPSLLLETLATGVRYHQLQTAERELLERTLRGSVKALADILAIARPDAFGRVARLRERIHVMTRALGVEVTWELDTAVLLSQSGCVSVAPELLDRISRGEPLSAEDETAFAGHAALGADLVAAIPRLDAVANIVRHQLCRFDGAGGSGPVGAAIPLGARLIHALTVYDRLRAKGMSHRDAKSELRDRRGLLDPQVVEVLPEESSSTTGATIVARMDVERIAVGMTIEEDVRAGQGSLLVCRGQEVTAVLLERLRALRRSGTVSGALLVRTGERATVVESVPRH